MNEEQEFLVEAQKVRDGQLATQGPSYQVDPAVQAGVDHAAETAGTGPEPGSGEPGFMGLGGLSKSDIEAQKQDIARREQRAGAG